MFAQRTLTAPLQDLFDFLCDLENHWLLADRFVEVLELDRDGNGAAHGGRVEIRGPLGMRRTVVTRVVEIVPPGLIAGTATLAPDGTCALVCWTLRPDGDGTSVRLEANVQRASLRDRLLLATGGRAWLRRRFAKILETLDAKVPRRARPAATGDPRHDGAAARSAPSPVAPPPAPPSRPR
jgi:uncharacterized protein YndB with AHSA1/START domain